jgi:flagellar biosynthesis protein FlhB
MIYEIKRIPPGPVIKIAFFVFLFLGFLFGIFYGLIIVNLLSFMSNVVQFDDELLRQYSNFGLIGIIVMGMVTALFTSVISTVIAGIAVVCYNFFAGLFGGIKIEFRPETQTLQPAFPEASGEPAAGVKSDE